MQNRSVTPSSYHDEKLLYLLKGSARIFAEKGFHQTSIRDIARATGMSLAGLYYYVQGKDELLFLIQDHCFQILLQRWEEGSTKLRDPRERLAFFVENHLGFFIHNMEEMKILSHEADSLVGENREKMIEVKRRYVRILMDLLKDLTAQFGEKPPDVRTATFCLFGMMNWLYTWYDPRKDLPLDGLVETMIRIYFFGFLKAGAVKDNWVPAKTATSRDEYAMWQGQERSPAKRLASSQG
jgi:AcrR family transcriptional regulator